MSDCPSTWNPAASVTFHRTARRFAEGLAAEAGVNIDTGVYDKVRLFRAPNSRHPKTGLHKRRLSLDELLHLDAARVRHLAAAPEPFGLPVVTAADPTPPRTGKPPCKPSRAKPKRKPNGDAAVANGTPRLNRATLDFIRDGADQGDRHRLLFSAAANLAEFNCPPALAHTLLADAALDAGLSPGDVRRQIDCGLRHVGGPPLTAPETPPSTPTVPTSADPQALQRQLAELWADAAELQAEREAIQAEGCQLWPSTTTGPYGAEGGRR